MGEEFLDTVLTGVGHNSNRFGILSDVDVTEGACRLFAFDDEASERYLDCSLYRLSLHIQAEMRPTHAGLANLNNPVTKSVGDV